MSQSEWAERMRKRLGQTQVDIEKNIEREKKRRAILKETWIEGFNEIKHVFNKKAGDLTEAGIEVEFVYYGNVVKRILQGISDWHKYIDDREELIRIFFPLGKRSISFRTAWGIQNGKKRIPQLKPLYVDLDNVVIPVIRIYSVINLALRKMMDFMICADIEEDIYLQGAQIIPVYYEDSRLYAYIEKELRKLNTLEKIAEFIFEKEFFADE